MKKTFIILNLLISYFHSDAQSPSVEWAKCFGGSNSDLAYSIKQTADGGYINIGSSLSSDGDVGSNNGNNDYCIIKLNSLGVKQWQKSYGGSGQDVGRDIQQTTDRGYIVIGWSNSANGDVIGNHGDYDYWVLKLDSIGNIQWQKSLGGSNNDAGMSVMQTTDGGYIVGGISQSNDGNVSGHHGFILRSDYWVIKLDSNGNIQWQKSLGSSYTDELYVIKQTSDNGYIIAGFSDYNDGDVTINFGFYDYWIVKLNNSGSITWQKSYGGSGSEIPQTIQQTTDGGYIIAGYTDSNNGDLTGNYGSYDIWVLKINASGNIMWQKNLGGSNMDIASSIQETTGGGYILTGNSGSTNFDVSVNNGGSDYWVAKLNNAGIIQWQKSLGGSFSETAQSIKQTTDGGFVITGFSSSNNGDVSGNHGSSDIWVVKLSPYQVIRPISFLSFTANEYANSVLLNWKVSSFNNSVQFNIQRSFNGTDFSSIGSIISTSTNNYSFTDNSLPNINTLYYRIEIQDSLNVKKLSDTQTVRLATIKNEIVIFPNPSTQHITIVGNFKEIKIVDNIGRIVYDKTNITSQSSTFLNIENFAKGIYTVVGLTSNNQKLATKLMIE